MNYREKLHHLIPGGAHTYSRGDDQYPDNAPSILVGGKGCYVRDPEGKEYLDYGMGLMSVTVGYAYAPIVEAAVREIYLGNTLARPSMTELKAAELIIDLIPGAEMVKFAKNGSTVTSASVKLARAYTNRNYVAVCSDHPFFSYDDWFIGSTVVPKGVPEEHRKMTRKFKYNDIVSLKNLFAQYNQEIAAVIMEPVSTTPPCASEFPQNKCSQECECKAAGHRHFLTAVRELCDQHGAVLIFDEMRTGFRWHLKGAQHYFGVEPDLSTFGKGMANGFSVAALVGKKEIMDQGGIMDKGKERVFLISTTHGAEMCGLGAFIKTMEIYEEQNVVGHMWNYGKKLMDGINQISEEQGIRDCFFMEGYSCFPSYVTKDRNGNISMEFRTLFAQEMVNNGVLMPWVALSLSHGDRELEKSLDAVKKSLEVYSAGLAKGVGGYLHSTVIKPVFRKYN